MTPEQARKRVEELIHSLKSLSVDLIEESYDVAVEREQDAKALEILLQGQLADEDDEEPHGIEPVSQHTCPFCDGAFQ